MDERTAIGNAAAAHLAEQREAQEAAEQDARAADMDDALLAVQCLHDSLSTLLQDKRYGVVAELARLVCAAAKRRQP